MAHVGGWQAARVIAPFADDFICNELIELKGHVAVAFHVEARRTVALQLFECGLAAQNRLHQGAAARVELTSIHVAGSSIQVSHFRAAWEPRTFLLMQEVPTRAGRRLTCEMREGVLEHHLFRARTCEQTVISLLVWV